VKRALFLDRDGTLIADKHFLADPAGVELLPGAAEGLQRARELGFLLFLFSNQSGIGRGYYTMDDALRVNARMFELLGLPSPVFDDMCLAPEAPDQPSLYRKPSPRFIHEMIAKHGLDPRSCFMVGDRMDDARAGLNAGIAPVLLLTGKITDPASVPEIAQHRIPVFPDFGAFAATLR
jgi:D-glycero-D-manno-heptose 1,7-bisphosphate phosphatase